MELRRLQEMGGATLLVSVPRDWAIRTSLKKGSVVSIEESGDGGLLIYPVKSNENKPEKEIEIANPSRFGNEKIPSEITAAYLLGYDLIKVKGQHRISPKDRERIINSIKRLIGLEIVEEDALSITSQFLVDNTAVEPSKIFRRISSIVRAMISDSLEHLASQESTQFESIAQRDDEVDRLHFLLVRLIRSAVREPRAAGKFGLTSIDCLDYRVAANSLETAGDYAVELSNSISELGRISMDLKAQIREIAGLLDAIQDSATRGFLTKDFSIAQTMFRDYERLENALREIRSSNKSSPNLLHLVEIVAKISRCAHDVADLISPMDPA
ncbi:MAG: phosphate uptake regulator PhoU [Nitrososphaerales archaeon]